MTYERFPRDDNYIPPNRNRSPVQRRYGDFEDDRRPFLRRSPADNRSPRRFRESPVRRYSPRPNRYSPRPNRYSPRPNRFSPRPNRYSPRENFQRDGCNRRRVSPVRGRDRSPMGYDRVPVRRDWSSPRRGRHSPSRERNFQGRGRADGRFRSRSPRNNFGNNRSRSPFRDGRDSRKTNSRRSPGYRQKNSERIDNPPPSNCIGVFGLSVQTDESRLRDIFEQYGSIESLQLVMDKNTNQSRGYGFINYSDLDCAVRAKEESTGLEIDGRKIRVDYSVTKKAHTPTPGVYMGKRPSRKRFNDDDDSYRR